MTQFQIDKAFLLIKEGFEVLATIQDRIVGVKYQNQIGLSFHPELTNDTRIHEQFVGMLRSGN